MKKTIAIILSIITITICSWQIINQLDFLDIPSNKNEQYASFRKKQIDNRLDINACKKELLKSEIDIERKNKKELSNIAFKTQFTTFSIVVIQLILLVIILVMHRKGVKKLK